MIVNLTAAQMSLFNALGGELSSTTLSGATQAQRERAKELAESLGLAISDVAYLKLDAAGRLEAKVLRRDGQGKAKVKADRTTADWKYITYEMGETVI